MGVIQQMIYSNYSPTPSGFVTEWSVAAGQSITLPLINTRSEGALVYNCIVNRGDLTPDSTITAYNDADITHTYTSAGTYRVTIIGTMEGRSFNNGGSKLLITKIINWGYGLFNGFKYLKSGFYGCTNLNSIGITPISISGTGILTDGFMQTFRGCTSLTTMQTNLFSLHTNVSTSAFYSTFYGCTSLLSPPANLFRNNTLVSSSGFFYTFYNCESITSIPTDLFRYNTLVSSSGFKYTFQGCDNLISIPTDLFRYNVNVGASGFMATFRDCSSLTTISTDLFRYNTAVTVSAFEQCFYGCTSLALIPTDLFRYNTAVTTSAFEYCFYNCTSLTTIPTDLFRYNVNVDGSGFLYTFKGCINLTTIPDYLFRYNTSVVATGFQQCFYGCNKLQINPWTFYADGEQSTRFLNQSVNFNNCFYRTSFSGIQGTAPDLWNCDFGTGIPVKTLCLGGAGNSAISLSNYASIPIDWRT